MCSIVQQDRYKCKKPRTSYPQAKSLGEDTEKGLRQPDTLFDAPLPIIFQHALLNEKHPHLVVKVLYNKFDSLQ